MLLAIMELCVLAMGLYYGGLGIAALRPRPLIVSMRRLLGVPIALCGGLFVAGLADIVVKALGMADATLRQAAIVDGGLAAIAGLALTGAAALVVWAYGGLWLANVSEPMARAGLRRALARQGLRFAEDPQPGLLPGSEFVLPDMGGVLQVVASPLLGAGVLRVGRGERIPDLAALLERFKTAVQSQRFEGRPVLGVLWLGLGLILILSGVAIGTFLLGW